MTTESTVENAPKVSIVTAETLMELVRDPEAFETFFKKKATDQLMGAGSWIHDSKNKAHRLVLPDGSYIRLKFFDTVKRIFDVKNVEVPGRESYLSYIDVAVMPAGIKGYAFKTNNAQHVWNNLQSVARAKHLESCAKLYRIARAFDIDLDVVTNGQPTGWETYFAGNK